jgi:hypothetical protein
VESVRGCDYRIRSNWEAIMTKFVLALLMGTALIPVLSSAPAQAQATRTWVTGSGGSDANPCSRTAPCATFAGAISKTFINGIINCIDAGAYGAVTITKSITIDCHDQTAGVLASGVNGVVINIPVSANDPLRTVRLRNLNIDGTGASGTVGTRTGIIGVRIDAATIVYLDDMQVSDFTQHGVHDRRTTGGKLHIRNSTFRNNASTGVLVNPASGQVRIDADLEGVSAVGNLVGVTGANGARVQVKRSVMSENGLNGIESDTTAEVSVDDSIASNNGTGLFTSAGTLRVSNTDISYNGTRASGAWVSFGNNRGLGNTNPGTAPTAAGGPTTDLGQF